MPELSLTTLASVVEQLPVPVLLTTENGDLVAASHASRSLVGAIAPGDNLGELLRAAIGGPHTVEHRVDPDGLPHLLVALDERLAPVPRDVAALAKATAHDFNNLLGVIINFASLAASQAPAGTDIARDLDEVLVAARRAATLTTRLLQIAAAAPDHESK